MPVLAAKRATAIAALFILWSICSCAGAETLIERGLAQYNQGLYKQAADTLMSAVQANPNDGQVHYHLANALCRLGDYDRALREYQLGYSLSRTGPVAYYCRQAIAGCRKRVAELNSIRTIDNNNRRLRPVAIMNPSIGNQTTRTHGNVHCPVGSLSHPDGVDHWPDGPPPAQYYKWLKTFDLCMRKLVHERIRSIPNWETITGKCELYITIDAHNRLRARVERSDTDEAVNAIMLDAIKRLDGTNNISYHFQQDGFHFWYGIMYDDLVAQLRGAYRTTQTNAVARQRSTGATVSQRTVGLGLTEYKFRPAVVDPRLRGTAGSGTVFGKLLTPRALKATALRLVDFAPTGTLVQQEVNGLVVERGTNGSVNQQIDARLVEPLANGELTGNSLLNGKRAKPGRLLDPLLSPSGEQEVFGQVLLEKLSGQAVDKQVGSELIQKNREGKLNDTEQAEKPQPDTGSKPER